MQPSKQYGKPAAQTNANFAFLSNAQLPPQPQLSQIPPQQQQPAQIPFQYQQQMPVAPQMQMQMNVAPPQLYSNVNVAQMQQMPMYQQQQQQYIQMPNYNNFNYFQDPFGQPQFQVRLLNDKKQDKQKKIVAVIVSFMAGGSYDSLFTSVQQKSQQGTRVLVYSCNSSAVTKIYKQYKEGGSGNETIKEMIKHIKSLDADCVVFNWECSSNYGGQSFPQGKDHLFDFVKFVLDKGHMTMFSDFSLKALINEWDSHKLGPNPFKKVGETSAAFELKFQAKTLTECPSAQLQIVGEMAEGGRCHVEAMGGTIVYSVSKNIKQNQFYKLQILTIAQTDCKYEDADYILQVAGKKGAAGHILLTFKSGGHMLTSMGHWIQLMKIDTSEKKLFEVAEKQYGAQYAQQMKYEYAQMGAMEQKAYISSNAVNFVQNQAPCSNMMNKAMYSKKM